METEFGFTNINEQPEFEVEVIDTKIRALADKLAQEIGKPELTEALQGLDFKEVVEDALKQGSEEDEEDEEEDKSAEDEVVVNVPSVSEVFLSVSQIADEYAAAVEDAPESLLESVSNLCGFFSAAEENWLLGPEKFEEMDEDQLKAVLQVVGVTTTQEMIDSEYSLFVCVCCWSIGFCRMSSELPSSMYAHRI